MPKKIWVALAAAVAAALAMRKSVADQQAERDLWAEATDDVRVNDEPGR
ncbi:MAG: hypothetical protein IPF90_03650 [Actinomycetales bacterium]|nr:hypothetical protein [Candidatus Phosphoribacter baldrii]